MSKLYLKEKSLAIVLGNMTFLENTADIYSAYNCRIFELCLFALLYQQRVNSFGYRGLYRLSQQSFRVSGWNLKTTLFDCTLCLHLT